MYRLNLLLAHPYTLREIQARAMAIILVATEGESHWEHVMRAGMMMDAHSDKGV